MQNELGANQSAIEATEEQGFNIKELLERYLHYWPWFVLSTVIALFVAFGILRYTTPIFESKATLIFHRTEEKAIEGLAALNTLGITDNNKKLGNEMLLMKTPAVLRRVIEELQLNVSYNVVGLSLIHI